MEPLCFYTHCRLGFYHIFHLRVYAGHRMDCKFYPLAKGSQQQPTTAIWHNTLQKIQGGAVRLSARKLNRLNPVLDFFPFSFAHRVIGTLSTLLWQMGAQEGLVYVPVYSGAWFGFCIMFCSLSAWGQNLPGVTYDRVATIYWWEPCFY